MTTARDTARAAAQLAADMRSGKAFGMPQLPVLKRCRSCADPLLDDRFDYCPKCDREARGPFSHGEGE